MEIAPSTPALRTRKVRVSKPAEPESGTQVSAKAKVKAKAKAKAKAEAEAEVTPEPKAAPAKRRSVSKAGSKSTSKSASPPSIQSVTSAPDAATLQHMIATAAYFMAEQRGFMPGHEVEDWLLAEQLVLGTVRH